MLIDTHSHVDRYDRDGGSALKSALAEITQNRILTISNSMDLPSYERNLEIAELCNLVLPIFGVHPWNASQYANHLEDLELAIGQTPMLGEIGLDFHFIEDPSAYPAQVRVFEFLLAEASQRGMIAQLHTKGAELEVLRLLDNYRIPAAIVHWYSGPLVLERSLKRWWHVDSTSRWGLKYSTLSAFSLSHVRFPRKSC